MITLVKILVSLNNHLEEVKDKARSGDQTYEEIKDNGEMMLFDKKIEDD